MATNGDRNLAIDRGTKSELLGLPSDHSPKVAGSRETRSWDRFHTDSERVPIRSGDRI